MYQTHSRLTVKCGRKLRLLASLTPSQHTLPLCYFYSPFWMYLNTLPVHILFFPVLIKHYTAQPVYIIMYSFLFLSPFYHRFIFHITFILVWVYYIPAESGREGWQVNRGNTVWSSYTVKYVSACPCKDDWCISLRNWSYCYLHHFDTVS